MKPLFIRLLACLIAVLSFSCKKMDNSAHPSSGSIGISGTSWKVTRFVKDTLDLTTQFIPYSFTSDTDGRLTIQGNGKTYRCGLNWIDNNHTTCSIQIMGCDKNSVLWECQDNWTITAQDAVSCHLKSNDRSPNITMTWTKL